MKFYFLWNENRYKPSKFYFKLLLTLTTDTPDIFSRKFLLKKSKNISGISPGNPWYIFEGINVSLPISLSDINMERAHCIDAVTNQKFWFRRHITFHDKYQEWYEDTIVSSSDDTNFKSNFESDFEEMTIHDILIGNKEIGNTGLFEVFEEYLEDKKYPEESIQFYRKIMEFLAKRANGEIKTGARYMRDLVLNHPNYKKDSIVNNKICSDLIYKSVVLGMIKEWDLSLLGEIPDFMNEFLDF